MSGVIEKISFFFLEKEEKRRWEKGEEKEGKGKIVDGQILKFIRNFDRYLFLVS